MRVSYPTLLVVMATALPMHARMAAGAADADGGSCDASAATLGAAKEAYAKRCPGLPRIDCDPVGGGWSCSSRVIGARAPGGLTAPAAPSATPPTGGGDGGSGGDGSGSDDGGVGDVCESPRAGSLGAAQAAFDSLCAVAGFERRDCDPVPDGGWVCSSAVIGERAPGEPGSAGGGGASGSGGSGGSGGGGTDGSGGSGGSGGGGGSAGGGGGGRIGKVDPGDLVALHYDNCPDPDDGHAIAAGKSVVVTVGLPRVIVANGTCGDAIRDRYRPESVAVARAAWGNDFIDAFGGGSAAVDRAAEAWAGTLANGDDVWVADGGPSDFTARVLRRIGERFPSVDRKRVHVVQHSAGFNRGNTSEANLALVRNVADYIEIPNGNVGGNGSADLNMQSSSFVAKARASRFATEWNAAFDYLDPNRRLDFSDTVELLFMIEDNATKTVDDFAERYL